MNSAKIQSLFQVTEVELIYRNKIKPSDRPVIVNAEAAYNLLLYSWDMNKIEMVECFKIIMLDRRNSVLGISETSSGGVNECIADPKVIFATALKSRASHIILAHNHPSGFVEPSQADIALTNKLIQGGRLLDISVLDHLIVTPDKYYSFANEGVFPP